MVSIPRFLDKDLHEALNKYYIGQFLFLCSLGVNKVRMSANGKELPNVRILRTSLFPNKDVPDDINMLMVMQWGQLIAHDTTHIVQQDSGS